MTDSTANTFHFPGESSLTQLIGRLAQAAPVHGEPVVSARRCFLDTFDWRLFAAGYQLECLEARGRCRLRLSPRNRDGGEVELSLSKMPQYADDLPAGPLRQRLRALSGGRALMRRSDEALRLWRGEMNDRRGKVVARLEVTAAPRRRGAIAVVRGLRGFDKWSKRLSRCLSRQLGGEPWSGDRLMIETARSGVAAGEHPRWRLSEPLDPHMRSDAALRKVLGYYTEVMALNVDGVRDNLDPGFLHEFRIGVRRCRTLLKRTPGVFPQQRTERFLADFAWLSTRTGPSRDLDVYTLDFPRYLHRMRDVDDADLQPFIDEIAQRREQAHGVLTRDFEGAQFKRRFAAWQQFLASPVPRAPRRRTAEEPVADCAARALRRVARKLYRQGDAITPDSPAEAYHELRKIGKNLRYLNDAFESLLAPKHVARVRARLKHLQDVLGAHQDLEVQSEYCAAFAARLDCSDTAGERTRRAADTLARHLSEDSVAARKHFAEHYGPLRQMKLHKGPTGS